MASLFLAGGTIGALSMVLPHSADANDAALWSNIAVAYLSGGLLIWVGPRLPWWDLFTSASRSGPCSSRAPS
jgi:hypothetical protein